MGKLQIRRGTFATLPTLDPGEPDLTTDAKRVFLGHPDGNMEMQVAPGTTDFTVYMATTALGGLDKATQGATGLQLASGTTDGTTASKLVDSGASFTSALVNNAVYNSTDDTWAKVTAVDSTTVLSVSADIFVSGEGYEIASAIDNLPEAFATADSGFKANIIVRISPGTFTDAVELIGKTAGDAKTLTIQGSTSSTTTIAGEVSVRQKIFLADLTFTKRIFLFFGADIDWTTCVTSGDDGFIITKSTSIANVFRSSSVVVFENDPSVFENISSTVTIGYTQYVADSTLGGSDSNDGYLITQGSATSTTANKLIDSTANFNTTDHLNKTVYNSTDDTWAEITAIDSTTQVTLDTDIMVSGESYIIASAKASIQNSWDSIPGQYNCDTGIHISDDIYREDVDVFGKTASGPFAITFTGTRVNTDTGTATAGANLGGNGAAGFGTLTDSGASWAGSTHQDNFVEITSGTGSGQIRVVHDNTGTVATITGRWDIVPDATSVYRFYTNDTRVTGANGGAETTPVRDYCFKVDNGQKGINLLYLKVDYAGDANFEGSILVFGGGDCNVSRCRIQGSSFWGIHYSGASTGSVDTVVFIDIVIGDLRADQAASCSSFKRCRSTGSGNRSVNASTAGSVFDVYESYVTGSGSGILADNGGIIVIDAYLDVDNWTSDNISSQQNSNIFVNTLFGAASTIVSQNSGGWGMFASEGGIGRNISTITYSLNTSGTFTPVTALAGGNT